MSWAAYTLALRHAHHQPFKSPFLVQPLVDKPLVSRDTRSTPHVIGYFPCHSPVIQRVSHAPPVSLKFLFRECLEIFLSHNENHSARILTYHLRTLSMAAITFFMSSLARLRVSARTERPDIVKLDISSIFLLLLLRPIRSRCPVS